MSRIGRAPIAVPAGVEVKVDGNTVTVKGAKGTLTRTVSSNMNVTLADGVITVTRPDDSKENRSLHGLTRTLINNMVVGVSEGFSKTLIIAGVGYKAAVKGDTLVVNLGYSHDVEFKIEPGLKVECPTALEIVVKGANKEQVGQFASNIRDARRVEPYHGYGVHYADEKVIRKVGKTAAKGKK